jgi:hypothetical protein
MEILVTLVLGSVLFVWGMRSRAGVSSIVRYCEGFV